MENKTALIVIDIQKGIQKLFRESAPYSFDEIIEKNTQLISVVKESGGVVILVNVIPPLMPKAVKEKFKVLSFPKRVIKNTIQLTKTSPSAFKSTDLLEILKENEVKELWITGVATDNGVKKTAFDAHQSGFKVKVIEPACGASSIEKHLKAVNELKSRGIEVNKSCCPET